MIKLGCGHYEKYNWIDADEEEVHLLQHLGICDECWSNREKQKDVKEG